MSSSVIFVVDLDAAGAPPATDSVRQLLALIEGLPSDGGELDWRLVAVSLNSPLRAELKAFTPKGDEAPEARLTSAAETAFALLDATNDNEPEKAARALSGEDRKRLRAFLSPMKDRTGKFQVLVSGKFDRTVRAERAQQVLAAISRPSRKRAAEFGSVEGQILAATTYYGSPALRVRKFLSDEEVLCVFDRAEAAEIGATHTLDEVWTGQRVVVTGKITYGGEGKGQVVHASAMRALQAGKSVGEILDAMHSRGDNPIQGRWDHVRG